ncbi:MAG: tetratricopeptide repeat-containing sensor histidine kinase [Aurantibacter sp.]
MKIACVFILSIFNSGLVFSQIVDFTSENPYKKVFVDTDNFGPSYLDQLEDAYLKATPDSLQFSILNDLAYYWHTRNLVKAMDFTEKGLSLTNEKSNVLWEGRFQITQGAILLRMEKLDDAQVVLESAKNKVMERDLAFLNTQLGYVYERRGQLDRAADYALESLNLGKKLNDTKAVAMAYSDLSNLFWKQSKFEAGLEYGLKSLETFEEWGITDLDYGFTIYVVGNNYLALKEYDKALQHYKHSLVIGERYDFYNNLSDVYISLVDLYAYLGEFDQAAKAGANAIKYAELLDNEFMLMRSWLSVGKLQHLQGDYNSAIESLKKCIVIATDDFGDEYYLSQAYEALGKAYAGNHEYQSAYEAFAEYDTLKNRIFTAESDQRTSLIRTEFDVAGKEGTILEQETQLKKQRTRQTLISIITGLLLLLLFLSYKAIRNKFKVNELLRKQNEEKEFLLKEIHHRVKNNLEIVSSLLALQSAQIKDTNVLVAMEESRHRVQSMSMIHQKLYMGKNMAAIEMKDYLIDLAEYIADAFGMKEQVAIDIEMKKLELDVDMAIPIGLIINELLTNSLKYAFPSGGHGKIKVALTRIDDHLQLDVNDNGVGRLREDRVQGTGFGMQLIELLTQQLDGKMVLNTNQGTSVSIQFQHHKAA